MQTSETESVPDNPYSKEDLINTVKKWVYLDNQIKQLNTMLKTLRNEKKEHNVQMVEMMKASNIDNLELKDGQIQYKKYSKRESLTQKKLLDILTKHPQLQSDQVKMLNDYVYENRKVVDKDVVIRKTHS
jgi:seryl-tRNA synthetase